MIEVSRNSLFKRITACICAIAFACSLVPALAFATPADGAQDAGVVAQADANGLNVDYHSERQIRAYYNTYVGDLYAKPSYDQKPQLTSPYSFGKLSQSSLNQALATLNFIRYVAGLDSNVTLDAEYNNETQAAAVINAINGSIDHYPARPSGMSNDMFELATRGASTSNLYGSSTTASFGSAFVEGWLSDSDQYNIPALGHRRWILNPHMGKTGFGIVDNSGLNKGIKGSAAMYTNDRSNSRASQNNVAWPAQNTPVELFNNDDAWSLITGTSISAEQIRQIKVTLTRNSDQKVWNFAQNESDGEFYVSNDSYGQPGCIIFRPRDISIGVGSGTNDFYTVSVTGLSNPISYNVSFFGLEENKITSISLESSSYEYTGAEIRPKVTARYYDRVLTEGRDYEVSYRDNIKEGTAGVTVTGIGEYAGSSLSTTFTITPVSSSGGSQGGAVTPLPSDPKGTPVVMYRLYNPNSGEHFYTASEYERAFLINEGWNNEDVGWIAPSEGDPVYRLYNSFAGEHHYTLSAYERDYLVNLGWNDEGIGWHSGGMTPLYRQYNPNAYANNHNYTTSTVERDNVLKEGWNDEGIGWYGIE